MSTTLRGIRLVAAHEFRMRLRTGRWKTLLAVWTLLNLAFTWFLDSSLRSTRDVMYENGVRDTTPIGPQLFGFLMLFVLGLMLVVSPTLTSQSVNGDRERGTLATLQVTLLSPTEIGVGKLLAGWSVGLVALGLTVPFVAWSLIEGGVGVGRAVAVLLVVALLIGVICAVAQALSALLVRSISSSLLSYVATAALTFGTLIAFWLAASLTTENQQVHGFGEDYTTTVTHPEEVWWLMAPNPFVVLADSAPALPPLHDSQGREVSRSDDPLGGIRKGVRSTRRAPFVGPCGNPSYATNSGDQLPPCPDDSKEPPAVWPWGLAFDLLLGGLSLWITIRRLRTPATKLGRGVRVA